MFKHSILNTLKFLQPYFFLGPEANKLNPKILEICLYGRSMGHCAQGLQSWTHHTLIHSFIRSFSHSFINAFIHSLIHSVSFHLHLSSFQFSSVHLFMSFPFSSVQFISVFCSAFQFFIPFIHSFIHSLIHSCIHSLNHYFIPSFLCPSFLLSSIIPLFIHSCMWHAFICS